MKTSKNAKMKMNTHTTKQTGIQYSKMNKVRMNMKKAHEDTEETEEGI